MFIHLGGNVVVAKKNIIAIMDLEACSHSVYTKNFLKMSEEDGFVIKISEEDEPKAFVLAERKKKTIIYLTPISSMTLFKRAGFLDDISLIK